MTWLKYKLPESSYHILYLSCVLDTVNSMGHLLSGQQTYRLIKVLLQLFATILSEKVIMVTWFRFHNDIFIIIISCLFLYYYFLSPFPPHVPFSTFTFLLTVTHCCPCPLVFFFFFAQSLHTPQTPLIPIYRQTLFINIKTWNYYYFFKHVFFSNLEIENHTMYLKRRIYYRLNFSLFRLVERRKL